MRRFPLFCLAALPVAVALSAASANPDPLAAAMPVSPGAPVEGAVIATRCPTFSWGAAAGAQAYELAVFDARYDHRGDHGIQMARGAPLLEERIQAPALSWTPAGRSCLDEGEGYLWFVRPLGADGEGEWSEGWFFRVEGELDGLSEVVRREVGEQLGNPTVWREGLERLRQEAPETYAAASEWMAAATSPRLAELLRGEATAEWSETGGLAPMSTEVVPQAATFPNPAAFRVSRAGGVLFHGDQGGIPAEGAGTRLMWYPGKAAFRAGAVEGVGSNAWDDANIGYHSFATGRNTTASGTWSTALGRNTTASGFGSTALGRYTTASGFYSTATGYGTTASGSRSTAMGEDTTASGSSSTAMGWSTTAIGSYSTAMGDRTTAQAYASLVLGRWNVISGTTGSWVATDPVLVVGNGTSAGRSNAFTLLKNGNLTIAGTLTQGSDRSVKENFAAVDAREVLEKVAALPIETWNYRTQPDTVRHMGPMSQDFRALFGLGQDDVTISTVDSAGVALAAIQGLHQLVQEQQAALEVLREENRELAQRVAEVDVLRDMVLQLEARMASVVAFGH